ncbi:MAG: class I SAM-dependent rRNA methyltransferase [Alphaproteobacteria bacterium]|nr:class I SAM-dependent rRNA methyltransferase [Alphaproteobacteria bacterium]
MRDAALPNLRLLPRLQRRALGGHPWIYANELAMDAASRALPPGGLARFVLDDGRTLGVGFFNPRSLIAGRLLIRDAAMAIDADFFSHRLAAALALRRRLFAEPYYRLAHGEADGLPGLVVDRYDTTLVLQANAAGMDRLSDLLVDLLARLTGAATIVLRNDTPARALEGLPSAVTVPRGQVAPSVPVVEDGARFAVDVLAGQKTGWFFDQREARAFLARLARGCTVLDLYCYVGGFAVQTARAGAREVLAIDRSEPALALARQAAAANGVGAACRFERAEAFDVLARLAAEGRRFELVIADPPPFARSRKDVPTALAAYRKLARLAAEVAAPGGVLFLASCSHAVEEAAFREAVARGLGAARRTARILRAAGAGADHPVHMNLPESVYLKTLTLQLD